MSRDPFGMTVVWDTPRRADWEAAEKIVRMLLSGKSADEQALDPAVQPLDGGGAAQEALRRPPRDVADLAGEDAQAALVLQDGRDRVGVAWQAPFIF